MFTVPLVRKDLMSSSFPPQGFYTDSAPPSVQFLLECLIPGQPARSHSVPLLG